MHVSFLEEGVFIVLTSWFKTRELEFRRHVILYLIWMDDQYSFPVVFLHLVRCHQISHAHRLPAGFTLPQHRVQS